MPKKSVIQIKLDVDNSLREAIAMAVGSDHPADDRAVENHFQLMNEQYALKLKSDHASFKSSGGR